MTAPTPNPDPFDLRRIRRFVELMKEHELSEIDIREGQTRIRLRRGAEEPTVTLAAPPPASGYPVAPAASPAGLPKADEAHIALIKSPIVGTFYTSPQSRVAALRQSGRPRRSRDHRLHRRGDESPSTRFRRRCRARSRPCWWRTDNRSSSVNLCSKWIRGADVQSHTGCQSRRDRPADLPRLPRDGH